jgi:glycosyltransferase involved in cell wall biosynthesis
LFFYRRCAGVVGITDGFKRYLLNLGLRPERVAVIPNGVAWETFAGVPPSEELRRTERLDGRFLVGYVGNMGLAQRLDTVLEAAEQLRHEPVTFLFLGEGIEKQRLMALARARALGNVRFLGGVPRQQVPSVLATCDALLVILRDDPLFEITMPSKIYEYMAAAKPILCSVGGEAAALVAESGCGLPVRPSDGEALAESIRTLLADPLRCRALGEAGAACARARFARPLLMGAYADLLERLPGKKAWATQEARSPLLGRVNPRKP